MEVDDGRALRERRTGKRADRRERLRRLLRRRSTRLGDDVAIRTAGRLGRDRAGTSSRDRVQRIAGGLAQLGAAEGRHRRADAQQPPRVHPLRPRRRLARRRPVLDLPDLLARADRLRRRRRRARRSRSSRRAFLERFKEARASLPDARARDRRRRRRAATTTLEELEAADPGLRPGRARREVEPDDLLTLIYTSGTTGPPKGVQLTHRNLMALTARVEDMIDLPERGGKVISWLPAAHIAERGAHYYLPVVAGCRSRSAPTRARSSSSCRRCARPGSSPCRGSGRR